MSNEAPLSLHGQFLRDQFGGANWVLARRTANIVRHYGEDVKCISKRQYRKAEYEYRKLFGDPNDAVRAELYCALKALCEQHAKPVFQGNPYTYPPEWHRAFKALAADTEV